LYGSFIDCQGLKPQLKPNLYGASEGAP
jgi:hypothetical protein